MKLDSMINLTTIKLQEVSPLPDAMTALCTKSSTSCV